MRNLFLIAAVSLAWSTAYAKGAGEKIQTKAYDVMDKDVTTVEFKPGSSELTEAQKRSLRSVVNAVRDDTKVEGIVVASWADKELPTGEQELSEGDRKLADERAENVEEALEELGASNVETHSMAEQAGWIAKTFGTDEAEVKGVVKNTKTAEDRVSQQIGSTLKDKGGPSTAVVIVKRAHSAAAE